MNLKSIRWRLPASYAAIALLATLVLGGVMTATLRGYYGRQERENMLLNAEVISYAMAKMLNARFSPQALQEQVKSLSFLVQARVRLLGPNGETLADSGVPDDLRVMTFSARLPAAGEDGTSQPWKMYAPALASGITIKSETGLVTKTLESAPVLVVSSKLLRDISSGDFVTSTVLAAPQAGAPVSDTIQTWVSADPGGPVGLIAPVKRSLYGFALDPASGVNRRSSQEVSYPVLGQDGREAATVVISDGPAYGWEIVDRVVRSWTLASVAAVGLAAVAGWLASRQITRPLQALAGVTAQMAAGDLSVRAEVGASDEFSALGRSFNEMAAQIEETVLTLRNFVADAAHELHTPLTALHTNLELAARTGDPAVAAAQAQVGRLATLVDGLLDLSRIEARLNGQDRAPVDLCALVREMAEAYASRAEQAGLFFRLDLAEEAVTVAGNRGQLRQALGNLLENAIKFTPPGGSIGVGARRAAGLGLLWVADTGIGIPAEDLPRLFRRFHRGRNAAAYPGSGLGLAIVQAIVKGHGGEVQVDSSPGQTRFTILLPEHTED